jgi:hypothetical protein
MYFDIARCAGRYAEAKSGPLTTALGHVDCVRCRRRTEPGHPTHQVHKTNQHLALAWHALEAID